MMEIIPAIDLINGTAVRLIEGDFNRQTIYSENPLSVALSFQDAGLRRLHIVDLEGARNGAPKQLKLLHTLCRETDLNIDFGGGVRERIDVEKILEAGAQKVSIGSIALSDPKTVMDWIAEFGYETFFVGADVRDGHIATHAWLRKSKVSLTGFIDYWNKLGVADFFCTDISRDGTLKGPATELYRDILADYPNINLVASGGVSGVEDLENLSETGVTGVIIGKAFYEGKLDFNHLKPWIYAG
ncbi:MAG: 1-(5-phosphoribosyl)-5-[(5-phosphoribosylamino)methylideneamino]imidazole-4-carboxamide isomerase [Bacteroidetes bacterium]|jgi:phosphoribosylformimino-5-aminoimidazole carboxamide ribotide isomerase|nr:1-(5-phosphoribosyl)-5-[(5-phosphoribosylamino)methylideneamino]imidazole-4-carboxamide isomerase [Bacteroidota bacterium]MBT3747736.1 1-(5-phosphoribosyl)-5-[(5-phosphoribosylamino)methylideneamino]imidazole-4-carboxamide isomerase [Bacteroidota bacterium]MBT4402228.1 1-(5-phosphoribosyl)-5-[(5-phosphoribosylamino)methylideneamino]imidazole-4-carboxamide isomerase [Bacteroidota bacterium]MBT4411340.1 1-(5-phosphoribosyl)-5-[(5-phosphoribosylamino)methylideneamino]imidazole-4-carboxamide isom